MKRLVLPELVYKYYSFIFYKLCSKCKKEFVRERGWRTLGWPIINRNYTERCYCLECCPNANDARKEADIIPPRPPPPVYPIIEKIIKLNHS